MLCGPSAGAGMISLEHSCGIPEILHIKELSAKENSPQCVSQKLKNMRLGSIFSTRRPLKLILDFTRDFPWMSVEVGLYYLFIF